MTAGSQGHCLVRDMESTQRRERATEVPPQSLEEQEARGLAGRQGNREPVLLPSPHPREPGYMILTTSTTTRITINSRNL